VSGRGDWSAYVNVGLGLLWPLADWGRLTLDARYRWDDNQGEIGRDDNFDDVLVTLGLQIPLGPKPRVAEAPRAAPPDVEVIQQLYQAAGTYRVVQGRSTLDLVGGGRYNYVKGEIELDPGILAGQRESRRADWWDGFVGARVLLPFAARWSIVGYADTGAEGSDLTWQALAAVNYHLSPTISAKLGYRHLSVDYEQSNFLYDIVRHGYEWPLPRRRYPFLSPDSGKRRRGVCRRESRIERDLL
jgi:hypothetical protein